MIDIIIQSFLMAVFWFLPTFWLGRFLYRCDKAVVKYLATKESRSE